MMEYTEGPDGNLAQFLETTEWVVEIDEYKQAPERYSGMILPGWISQISRAWLIVPLMQHQRLLGFMVLVRPRAPRNIEWEDRDLLKAAGRQVASHLAQLQASEALFNARQFETFNRISAYVVHDLKNLVAQLSLVVSNAARHKHNPQFLDDAILTVNHCVVKINRLLAQLRMGRDQGRDQIEKTVRLVDVVNEALAAKQFREPIPVLSCWDGDITVRTDPARLGTVVGNVIQNAQEATPPEGTVSVMLYSSGQHAIIEIKDSGCGMDAEFIRDRLFRPFETTKGNTGMGIGAYEAREWVREHGGEVEVESQPGHGTVFRIRLPCTGEEKPRRQQVSGAPETTL